MARVCVDAGWYVSLSGTVSFRNAHALREAALLIPEDQLLVETDAPYLAPVPFRGKRCEPAMVAHTAKVLAEVRGMEMAALEDLTSTNFRRLFKKMA